MPRRSLLAALIVLAAAAVTAALATALAAGARRHVSAQTNTAQVRFFHAGLDVPSVDVAVGGVALFPEVRAGELTNYRDAVVAKGPTTEVVVTLGGDPTRELVRSSVLLAVEDRVTIALAGPSDNLTLRRYADDSPPVNRDDPRSWLRLVQLAHDGGSVDVLAEGGAEPWIEGVSYGSASPFNAVAAGDYALRFIDSGTGALVHRLAAFTAPSYIATTLFMFGSREGGTLDVLVITDRPWRPTLTPTPYGTQAPGRTPVPSRTPLPGRTPAPGTTPGTGTMRTVVRVFHGAVGQPAFDVLISGRALVDDLKPGEASEYAYVLDGTQGLEVLAAGLGNAAVRRTSVDLRAGAYQTVVLTAPDDRLTATLVTDGTKHTGSTDTADIRFIHAAPDGGAVEALVSGGPSLATNASYFDIGEYSETPQGQCAVIARSLSGRQQDIAFPLEKVQAATPYSAYLIGDGQGEALRGVILRDSGAAAAPGRPEGEAMLRLVNALPGVPSVDLLVGPVDAVSALAYGRASGYLPFTGETTYRFAVRDGASGVGLIESDLLVRKDTAYSLVAAGAAPDPTLVSLVDELVAPEDGRTSLRFVHVSADSPSVRAAADGGVDLAGNLPFGSAGRYVDLPGGFTDVAVTAEDGGAELVEVTDVWLKPLAVYTAFLIGELAEGSLEVAVVRDADFGEITPTPPAARQWRIHLPIGYR